MHIELTIGELFMVINLELIALEVSNIRFFKIYAALKDLNKYRNQLKPRSICMKFCSIPLNTRA